MYLLHIMACRSPGKYSETARWFLGELTTLRLLPSSTHPVFRHVCASLSLNPSYAHKPSFITYLLAHCRDRNSCWYIIGVATGLRPTCVRRIHNLDRIRPKGLSYTAKFIQSVPGMILPPYSIRHNHQSEPGMIASNNLYVWDVISAKCRSRAAQRLMTQRSD